MTGLSFPTVMKVADFLISRNIVHEAGGLTGGCGPGRKGRLLTFNPEACRAVGFEYEGHFANIGIVNLLGEVIERQTIWLDQSSGTLDLGPAAVLIHSIAGRSLSSTVLGAGIGLPAWVNSQRGSIMRYSAIGIKEKTPFEALFPDFIGRIGMPWFVGNDVNHAAVGEMFRRRRAGPVEDLVYLSLGTGFGAGILMDGRLRHGAHCRTGEIGNVLLDGPDGGRLEERISLGAIRRKFGIEISRLEKLPPGLAMDIAEHISMPLSTVLCNLVNILDVGGFVLSGILPGALGDALYECVNRRMRELLPGVDCPVQPPAEPNAGIIGGAVTVFDNMIFDVLSGD
jgi:predicted NBD/HSP70 family sugar kinase